MTAYDWVETIAGLILGGVLAGILAVAWFGDPHE